MFEELREQASSWWGSEDVRANRRGLGRVAQQGIDLMEGAQDTMSGTVRRGADATIEGARFFEDGVDHVTHTAAGALSDIPVLGEGAEAAADAMTYGAQIGGGVVGGAADLTAAMSHAGTHPADTVRGLAGMASHIPSVGPGPLGAAQQGLRAGIAGYDAIVEGEGSLGDRLDVAGRGVHEQMTMSDEQRFQEDSTYWGNVGGAMLDPYEESVNEDRLGEVPGRAMFDAAMILLPGVGEVGAAGEVAEVAEVAEAARVAEVAEAARVAEMAEAARVAEMAEAARVAEVAEAARVAEMAEAARVAETAEGARVAEVAAGRETILPPEPVNPQPHGPRTAPEPAAPIEPANSPRPTSDSAPPSSSDSLPPEVDPEGTRIARARDMHEVVQREPSPPERVNIDDVVPEGEPNPDLRRNPADEARNLEIDREIDNMAWRQENPIQAGIIDADQATGGRIGTYGNRLGRHFGQSPPGVGNTSRFVIESAVDEASRLARWLGRGSGG
jgi:hypothetical protein